MYVTIFINTDKKHGKFFLSIEIQY